jgi:hypothetical protein
MYNIKYLFNLLIKMKLLDYIKKIKLNNFYSSKSLI